MCRVLGDVGNLVGPFNSRCNVGKEGAAKKAAPAQAEKAAQVRSCLAAPHDTVSAVHLGVRPSASGHQLAQGAKAGLMSAPAWRQMLSCHRQGEPC